MTRADRAGAIFGNAFEEMLHREELLAERHLVLREAFLRLRGLGAELSEVCFAIVHLRSKAVRDAARFRELARGHALPIERVAELLFVPHEERRGLAERRRVPAQLLSSGARAPEPSVLRASRGGPVAALSSRAARCTLRSVASAGARRAGSRHHDDRLRLPLRPDIGHAASSRTRRAVALVSRF